MKYMQLDTHEEGPGENKKIIFTHMYRMYSLSGQHSAVSGIPDSTGCRVCHVNVKTCTGTVKFRLFESVCLGRLQARRAVECVCAFVGRVGVVRDACEVLSV